MTQMKFKVDTGEDESVCLVWKNTEIASDSVEFSISNVDFAEDVPGDPLGGDDYSIEPAAAEIAATIKAAPHVNANAINLMLAGNLVLDLNDGALAALQSMEGQVDVGLSVRAPGGDELLEDVDYEVISCTLVLMPSD